MRIFIIGLLFLCSALQIKAQNLQGRVVDDATGLGIPFVSVGVMGAVNATVTNESGEFVLKDATYPIKIRFSHVSYLLTEVSLTEKNEQLVVRLKPASISLNLVTIDPFLGRRIVKGALENAKAHVNETFYANAFYRQLTTFNNKPSQIYELFYDLKWNPERVQGWQAKQSRFAELNEGITFSLSNQSYLTFSYSGYLLPEKSGKFLNLKNLGDYTITVEKYIEQADQRIAVVSCKFKSAKRKQYYVNSIFYVGMEDSKIYRLENSLYNLPIRLADASAKFPPAVNTVATFNGGTGEISTLESVSTKFLMMMSIRGQEYTSNVTSLLTVYKADDKLKNERFESLNRKTKDKNVIASVVYDPLFWKNNPVVKQTSLEDSFIKMMESKKAFGTMINP